MPRIPILWAAAGVATPIAVVAALYFRIAGFERSIPFAGIMLLLAALFAVAVEESHQTHATTGGRRVGAGDLRHRRHCLARARLHHGARPAAGSRSRSR